MEIKEIIDFLKKENQELKVIQKDIEAKLFVIKKLMPLLNNNKIYNKEKNLLLKYFNIDYKKDNLKEIIFYFKKQTEELPKQLGEIKNNIEQNLKIINAYKYRQFISINSVTYLKSFLTNKGFDDLQIIKTSELIRIYNNTKAKNNPSKISSDDLFLVTDMLRQGYEQILIDYTLSSDKLDNTIKQTINFLDNNPLDVIEVGLNIESLYSPLELDYIYKSILKHYQDEIFNLIGILKVKEFYFDIPTLEDIKNDYKSLLLRYKFIREKLDSLNLTVEDEIEEETKEVIDSDVNNLVYASNEDNNCYLLRDLKSIREESLGQILELLNEFKMGNSAHIKILKSPSNYFELKDDQIRIILKPLSDNYYWVVGAFIKKDNNDRLTYQNMFNRPLNRCLDNKQMEEFIEEYIFENQRKGSRK